MNNSHNYSHTLTLNSLYSGWKQKYSRCFVPLGKIAKLTFLLFCHCCPQTLRSFLNSSEVFLIHGNLTCKPCSKTQTLIKLIDLIAPLHEPLQGGTVVHRLRGSE